MALPFYIDRNSDTFRLDSLSGEGGYIDGSGRYLIPHKREELEDIRRRAAYSVYHNYVSDIVNTYSGYLWKQPPNRDAGEGYTAFMANADGAGHSLDYVLQNNQILSMVLGTVYLIVDRAPVIPQTRAQQPAPYITMRLPSQVVKYREDSLGNLASITFRETVQESDIQPWWGMAVLQSMMGMIGKQQYRTYTVDGWIISLDEAGRLPIAQGAHTLGRVPVVRLNSTTPLFNGQLRTSPFALDAIQRNWDLYNMLSEKRTILRNQTFSILKIPVADISDASALEGLTIGTENALPYVPINGGDVGYISPDPSPVQLYQSDIGTGIEGIYESACLKFLVGVASSGTAIGFQFDKANSRMGMVTGQCEAAERETQQIVSGWNGETAGTVSYTRDFKLSDLATDLQTALDAKTLIVSETFKKEQQKQLAKKILGHGASAKILSQIDGEIEASKDPYGDRLQQQVGGL